MKNFTQQSKCESSGNSPKRPFIPAWVRTILPHLKGALLPVLVAYWSHANREGLAWPSIALLVRVTSYGKNSVKAARTRLVALGLLVPVEQYRDADGRYRKKVFNVCTAAQKVDYGTAAQFSAHTAAQKVTNTAAQKLNPEGTLVRSNPKRRSSAPALIRRNSEKKEQIYQVEVIYA